MTQTPYREPAPSHREIWDWDIAVVYGSVRITGLAVGCLYEGRRDPPHWGKCDCPGKRRTTSPITQVEHGYPHPDLDPIRHLLDAGAGDEFVVESGRTYRLAGPRQETTEFKGCSIWTLAEVERQERAKAEQARRRSWRGRLRRMMTWLFGAPRWNDSPTD